MTVGVLEALTSSFGDELTELGGFRVTRLIQAASAEEQVQDAISTSSGTAGSVATATGDWVFNNTATVLTNDTSGVLVGDFVRAVPAAGESMEDSDGAPLPNRLYEITSLVPNTSITLLAHPGGFEFPANPDSDPVGLEVVVPSVVTLGSGTFLASVDATMVFRLLSGALVLSESLIRTRDSGTQITLEDAFGAVWASQSWEIVLPADTVLTVESALGWPTTEGRVVVDGVLYDYAVRATDGSGNDTLEGITYFDGASTISGVAQAHNILAEVTDYTLVFSAIDTYRRSFLVDYATGEDLNVIGRNIGVDRPPELTDDDTFRALIKVLAYVSKGTIYSLELVLTALLGDPLAFEIFEDLTIGSINHPGKVYIRKTTDNSEEFIGKTFLDGDELVPITSTTSIVLNETPIIRVGSVHYADEPGRDSIRVIDEGTNASSVDLGVTITGPALEFNANIQPGDTFIITNGVNAGKRISLLSRTSATQLDAGIVAGSPLLDGDSTGAFGFNFANVSWQVVREVTNTRHYRPSTEIYQEYPTDPGTSIWEYVGATAEATANLLAVGVQGAFMAMVNQAGGGTTNYYRHPMRIQPTSRARMEVVLSDNNGYSATITDFDQAGFEIHDGERNIAVGIRDPSGTTIEVAFHSGGTIVGVGTATIDLTNAQEVFSTIQIFKNGRGAVVMTKNGRVEAQADHSAFAASALTEIRVGNMSAAKGTGGSLAVKQIDWSCRTPDLDLWNGRRAVNGQTTTATTLEDASALGTAFVSPDDVGRRVRITNFTTPNASNGIPVREWEIASIASADSATMIGPTEEGAFFDATFPTRLVVDGLPDAFRWPHDRGYSVEVLAGVNAGTYAIAAILDPNTFQDVEQPRENAHGNNDVEIFSTEALDQSGAQIRLVGLVGAAITTSAPISISLNSQSSPVLSGTTWDASSLTHMYLESGTPGALPETFSGSIIVRDAITGDTIFELKPNEVQYGRPNTATLHSTLGDVSDLKAVYTSNAVELTGAAFETDSDVQWRLVPNFGVDGGPVPFDVIDTGSEAAGTLTLREASPLPIVAGPFAYTPLVKVSRSRVLSAQVLGLNDSNAFVGPGAQVYSHYPFYLQDDWGFIRRVIKRLTVAGVFPDFDNFFRDSTGPHILED